MSNALTKSLARCDAMATTVQAQAHEMKMAGIDISPGAAYSSFSVGADVGMYRQRYRLFRGWLYAAVNALASEGAGQPACLGRIKGADANESRVPGKTKDFVLQTMSPAMREKAAAQEIEVIKSHPLLDAIEHPNDVQHRWQFTYNFIANLCLTGWSYIIGGEKKGGGYEFFSIPTTWVKPLHDNGPFSQFKIFNPKQPGAESKAEPLDRSQVAFAHLPNPSDPLSAMAPAESQMMAIRIDDHIQASQERFFENGIFPSVIVTIGKEPHPEVPGGIRPRLTGAQRRQVVGAIRKVTGGIANYGNPAIIDGLIEKIDRLSATQNEMGWEKSEKTIKGRILSAFSIHPYILGEPAAVGGYAQVANIEKRFYKRVNTYLDMLGTVMSNFAGPMSEKTNKLTIWWKQCAAVDDALESQNWKAARTNNDVTQDEFRAFLGLGPDEDRNEQVIDKASLVHIISMLAQLGQGVMTEKQAIAVLEGLGLPSDMAKKIAKAPPKPPEPAPGGPMGTGAGGKLPPAGGEQKPAKEPPTPEEAFEQATRALEGKLILPSAVADLMVALAR